MKVSSGMGGFACRAWDRVSSLIHLSTLKIIDLNKLFHVTQFENTTRERNYSFSLYDK